MCPKRLRRIPGQAPSDLRRPAAVTCRCRTGKRAARRGLSRKARARGRRVDWRRSGTESGRGTRGGRPRLLARGEGPEEERRVAGSGEDPPSRMAGRDDTAVLSTPTIKMLMQQTPSTSSRARRPVISGSRCRRPVP